ncbi:hypothetical protein D3C87_1532030 [compost metagenome]
MSVVGMARTRREFALGKLNASPMKAEVPAPAKMISVICFSWIQQRISLALMASSGPHSAQIFGCAKISLQVALSSGRMTDFLVSFCFGDGGCSRRKTPSRYLSGICRAWWDGANDRPIVAAFERCRALHCRKCPSLVKIDSFDPLEFPFPVAGMNAIRRN